MTDDTKNLILAIGLSIIVLIGWNYFYGMPQMEKQRQLTQSEQQAQRAAQPGPQGGAVPGVPGQLQPAGEPLAPGTPAEATREAALRRSARVTIDTPRIAGSIALIGGRLDDVTLKDYHETVDPKSPHIVLFSPLDGPKPYYADFGWVTGGAALPLPNAQTQWSADGARLTPATPVTLSWNNGQGLVFRRTIAVDDNAMFTVKDAVENTGQAPATLYPFALVARHGKPETLGYYVLHEGPVGVLGDLGLQEPKYDALEKDPVLYGKVRGEVFKDVTGGFLGITDKYWAAAVIPDQSVPYEARITVATGTTPVYQTDVRAAPQTVEPGARAEATTRLFAGAKEVATIDGYERSLGIKRFDLMIDWGWFYFITKPLFRVLDFFYKLVGNFGLAILIVTVLVKLAFYPLANKSYVSMAKMKAVQPEMVAIRDRYADDKVKQQQTLMELYKREKINPLAGCWPIFIQIPVFFALYKVLFVTIEMRHAPFFGWIRDLAAPDPTNLFTLFGLVPWNPPSLLHLGIWPIIMGVSMFVQMKMNPEPTDPVQKTMFSWMPVMFTFMLGSFPAGLVIYWTWNNTLSVTQQYFIMRKNGVRVELWDNLRGLLAPKAKPSS